MNYRYRLCLMAFIIASFFLTACNGILDDIIPPTATPLPPPCQHQRSLDHIPVGAASNHPSWLTFQLKDITISESYSRTTNDPLNLQAYVILSDGQTAGQMNYPPYGTLPATRGIPIPIGRYATSVDANVIDNQLAAHIVVINVDNASIESSIAIAVLSEIVDRALANMTLPINIALILAGESTIDQSIQDLFHSDNIIAETTIFLGPDENWKAGIPQTYIADNNNVIVRYQTYLQVNPEESFELNHIPPSNTSAMQQITDRNRQIAQANSDSRRAYHYSMRAFENWRIGQYITSIGDANYALQLSADRGIAYNARGLSFYSLGYYSEALTDFSCALNFTDESHHYIYNNRGLVYNAQENYPAAITEYNRSISLNRDYANAFHNRGNSYRLQGDYTNAIADFNEAIRLNSSMVRAYGARGMSYDAIGEYASAVADYQKYLDLGGGRIFGNQALIEEVIESLIFLLDALRNP